MVLSQHNVREGVPGKKFVMVIDLAKCKNAGKCKSACSKMHYLPVDRSYIKINKMQDSEKLLLTGCLPHASIVIILPV
jgi:molybdopterin-containing oxidoreductase family iron-sulfur binding subunit